MSSSFNIDLTNIEKVNVLQISLFWQDACMNPAEGLRVHDIDSSLNVQQADCGVIEEWAFNIIEEGFTEFIDDKGINRLLRFFKLKDKLIL